jgi:hypothetical protein
MWAVKEKDAEEETGACVFSTHLVMARMLEDKPSIWHLASRECQYITCPKRSQAGTLGSP